MQFRVETKFYFWLPSSLRWRYYVWIRKWPDWLKVTAGQVLSQVLSQGLQSLPCKWLKQWFSMCGPQDLSKGHEVKTIAVRRLFQSYNGTMKFPESKRYALTSSSLEGS